MTNDIPDEVVERVAKACAKDEGSNMLEWTPDYQDDEEMASYRETWLKFARCAILAYRAAMRERGIIEAREDWIRERINDEFIIEYWPAARIKKLGRERRKKLVAAAKELMEKMDSPNASTPPPTPSKPQS